MLNSNIRVDLHVHSKASEYKDGEIVKNSTFSNIDTLLEKLNKNKINLFGFSDHNRFDKELFVKTRDYIKLETTKDKFPYIKNILPVVEFDVKIDPKMKKCHILAVFDYNSKDENALSRIEKEINSNKLTKQNEFYDKDNFEKIIRKIGLDVILIASQRKALTNPKPSGSSLSDSTTDVYEFLKVGYISALEVQKSAVQGMILNDLKDLELPQGVAFTSGSDCHQWDVYPKHSVTSDEKKKNFYFTVRAKPTFTGLVMAFTSPESRFDRKSDVSYKYIESFYLNDKEIRLSPGINTIIGENGSGKSTIVYGLLNKEGKKPKHIAKLLKNNKFVLQNKDLCSPLDIHGIEQSELIENINAGFILGKEKKSDYFKEVNNLPFEEQVKTYAKSLFDQIKNNIELEGSRIELLESKFKFDLNAENYKMFYFQITIEEDFVEDNIHEQKLTNVNRILLDIKAEYKKDLYSKYEKQKFEEAFNILKNLRQSIIVDYKQTSGSIRVKNLILSKKNDYSNVIGKLISGEEKRIREYNDEKIKFKRKIINYYNKYKSTSWTDLKLDNTMFGIGMTINEKRGYKFIKRSKYVTENVVDYFVAKMFNKDFREDEKLRAINKKTELAGAITSANIENYEEKYNEKLTEIIKELTIDERFIQRADNNTNIGSTFGEQSLIYYDFIAHEDNLKSILIIDQPEDNISNSKIYSDLIDKFSFLRDKKQIILVTHNPMLVVNLDADNVIHLENNDGHITHKYGCLETEGIIPTIAKTMDGGEEALKRRFKIYGRSNN